MKFQTAALTQPTPLVQPTSVAKETDLKQSLRAAILETEELKQTLRYVEISLTKQKEENEALKRKVLLFDDEKDKMEADFKAKCKELESSQFEIEILNKRIISFSKNTGDQTTKDERKKKAASIENLEKDRKFQEIRLLVQQQEEEMKGLSLSREKLFRER